MVWKSPACCTFGGTEVQFFVTGSMSEDDYLRQQAIVVPGEPSKCDCKDGVISCLSATLSLSSSSCMPPTCAQDVRTGGK